MGDSIIKDIKPWEMSQQLNDTQVTRNLFLGASSLDMLVGYHIPPKMKQANVYLLHAGTNGLSTDDGPIDTANRIIDTAKSLKSDENEVIVSGLCQRGDEWNERAIEVNGELEKMCVELNFPFCKNDNINPTTHLNNSKLHLNTKGSRLLQKKFSKFLKF